MILRIFLVALLSTLIGCGKGESVPKQAGEALGKTVTEFGKGVGAGVDEASELKVELSEALKKLGVSHTVAKSISGKGKGISVYLLSHHAQTLTLTAKALNADQKEIGRASTDVIFAKDDAQYVNFTFAEEMDSLKVQIYTLDVKAP